VPTYYRDQSVRVTESMIEVGVQRIPLRELRYVWHRAGRPTLRTTSRRVARLGLIAMLTAPVIVGAVVVANLVASTQGPATRVVVVALLLVVGLLLLLLLAPVLEFPMMALERSYDRGTEVREIWVRWRDHDLMLLRTTDSARFGKIYRAIQRAVELQEE
jgi:hypothetical protein